MERYITYDFKGTQNQYVNKPVIKDDSIYFPYPCQDTISCSYYSIYLKRGKYKFSLWGARGGYARDQNTNKIEEPGYGGRGAFVSGDITLCEDKQLYLYIGGRGEDYIDRTGLSFGKGGFNGGGDGGVDLDDDEDPESATGGGGSTDIRLIADSNTESYKSRIIVAAGGGGSVSCGSQWDGIYCYEAGAGGNDVGESKNPYTFPGTQNSSSFYKGANGESFGYLEISGTKIHGGAIGGGGGGYYGGTSMSNKEILNYNHKYKEGGGAGGSSFVSGCKKCKAVSRLPIGEVKAIDSPFHYSHLVFDHIVMYDGKNSFKKPNSETYETGHDDNGAIVIIRLSTAFCSRKMQLKLSISCCILNIIIINNKFKT